VSARWCALVAMLAVVTADPARAIVMRDGMTDADALKLAAPLSAAGRVIPDGGCALVAAAWALTAHVADRIPKGGELEFNGKRYAVSRVFVHPRGRAPEGVPPDVDLALVELVAPVADIEPFALYRGGAEAAQPVTIVGYGDFGAPGAVARTDGRRRAATNVVDDAGPLRLFMAFDKSPAGTSHEGVGGPGDSGGPCLLEVDGKRYLCGISSASMNGRPGQYGVTDVYTRVSAHIDWIESTMKSTQQGKEGPR
jgi:hypothetical protein